VRGLTKTIRKQGNDMTKEPRRDERDSELSACVRKMMKQYFKDLDGEDATDIYDMVVANVERPLLEVVMHHAEGNQTRAAELLGLNRNTLRKKLTEHGIE
jgi:Fis family transcriptional regulator, factor for inversion stimulation protein